MYAHVCVCVPVLMVCVAVWPEELWNDGLLMDARRQRTPVSRWPLTLPTTSLLSAATRLAAVTHTHTVTKWQGVFYHLFHAKIYKQEISALQPLKGCGDVWSRVVSALIFMTWFWKVSSGESWAPLALTGRFIVLKVQTSIREALDQPAERHQHHRHREAQLSFWFRVGSGQVLIGYSSSLLFGKWDQMKY